MPRIEITYQEYTYLKERIEHLETELIEKGKLIKKYQHAFEQIRNYVDDIPIKDKMFNPKKINNNLSKILNLTENGLGLEV